MYSPRDLSKNPKNYTKLDTKKSLTFEEKVLVLTFIFTTFSGAIRKWVVSSSSVGNAILGIQLLVPLLLFYGFYRRKKQVAALPLLIVYILYLVISAFSFMNKTLYHGILGLILHSGFWLALFSYIPNRHSLRIEKLLPFFLWLTFGQLALGIVQYTLPNSHFLNRYAIEDAIKSIATVGEAVRVTGTFSYISGFGSFVIFISLLAWSYPLIMEKKKLLAYIIPWLAILGALLNGSRAMLAIALLCLSLSLIYSKGFSQTLRIIFYSSLIAIAGYFFSPRIQTFANTAFQNFMTRVTSNQQSGEQRQRVVGPVAEIINFRGQYPVFGVGLGSTYQGAKAIWGTSRYVQAYPGGYEEEAERIVIEGGFILFIFKLVLFFTFALHWHVPWGPKLILIGLTFFYIPIIFNIYNAYYILVGFILLDQAYMPKPKISSG